MEHNDYWAKRFEQLLAAEMKKADELSAEMMRMYRQAAQDINDDIARWYAKFAVENKMSLAEARRILNERELTEFRWTLKQYIAYGEKNALSGAYIQRLKNASMRVHIDRLEAIKYQMGQHIEKLAAKGNARLTDVLKDIYPDSRLRSAYEVQRRRRFEPFAQMPETDVDRILKRPWVSDGLNFSDRIWRDKERLLNVLQGEMTVGLIRGEAYPKIVKRVSDKMGVAMGAASRLVETEAAFFASKGQMDAFRDLGVEQYEFVATLDSRTSERCREMDGKVLPMSEFKPGITAPPLHCRCRSTTCPYFDDEFTEGETRAARDPETGETMQVEGELKYKEWEKKYVDQPKQEESAVVENKGDKGYNEGVKDCLQRVKEFGIRTGREVLAWVDADGGTPFPDLPGAKDAVIFTSNLDDFLQKAPEGSLTSVHNHPRSSSFSPEDFDVMAGYRSISQLRVIGHDGTQYTARVGTGARPKIDTIRQIYRKYVALFQAEFEKKVNSGEMSSAAAWREHSHRAAQETAKEFGWEYERTMPDEEK